MGRNLIDPYSGGFVDFNVGGGPTDIDCKFRGLLEEVSKFTMLYVYCLQYHVIHMLMSQREREREREGGRERECWNNRHSIT